MFLEVFLKTVAEDIGVPYVSGDRSAATILRLAYSVAGRNALATLWDAQEEDETAPPPWRRDEEAASDAEERGTSVRRFKERVAETLRVFLDVFSASLTADPIFGGAARKNDEPFENDTFVDRVTDCIFDLYRENGFFYSLPYYVAPPMKTAARVGESFAFVRGVAPCDFASVAGLGTYWTSRRNFDRKAEEANERWEEDGGERGGDWLASAKWRKSVAEMFAIDVSPLKERFKTATQGLVFSESVADEKAVEFLETNRTRGGQRNEGGRRYWKSTPDADDERVSLAKIPGDWRTGAETVYYWTRVEKGRRLYRQIPSWQTEKREWLSLANAILASRDALPATTFQRRGDVVVRFGETRFRFGRKNGGGERFAGGRDVGEEGRRRFVPGADARPISRNQRCLRLP